MVESIVLLLIARHGQRFDEHLRDEYAELTKRRQDEGRMTPLSPRSPLPLMPHARMGKCQACLFRTRYHFFRFSIHWYDKEGLMEGGQWPQEVAHDEIIEASKYTVAKLEHIRVETLGVDA